MISTENIETAGYEIMKKAAIDIPDDYLNGIKATQSRSRIPCQAMSSKL